MDPTICSILRPLRSWASSPSLSPRASGRGGGRQLKVPVPRDDLVPFGETIGSATTHHGFVSSLRPPALSPSLSRTGKPRPAAISGTPPRHPTSGTLFPRPRLSSPAVRATSLRRQALSTSLPHLRQVFYSSLLHEHEHRDRGPHGLHDAASCSLAPTDALYPPSDPLELDPQIAFGSSSTRGHFYQTEGPPTPTRTHTTHACIQTHAPGGRGREGRWRRVST